MNKTEAISNINKRASQKEPFLFVINYNMDNCFVLSPKDAYQQNILFNFNGIKNYFYEQLVSTNIKFEKFPVDYKKYRTAFNIVQKHLNRGNSYLVNLTFPTPVETNLSLKDIFYSACAKYKLLMKDRFMVFSPESFVKIENGKISTYPMKGTIDAGKSNAPEKILANEKELADFLISFGKGFSVKPVLMAAADNYALMISHYAEELAPYFRFPALPPGLLEKIIDKKGLSELARDLRLRIPTTYTVMPGSDTAQIASDINYPCIIKPALSHKFVRVFRQKCLTSTTGNNSWKHWIQPLQAGWK